MMKFNGRFFNPHAQENRRHFLHFLLWVGGYYKDRTPQEDVPESFCYPLLDKRFDPSAPSVTWINHSSFLIQIDGLALLTDPIFSNRCSPLPFLGPKRQHAPGISLDALPKIDYVLISHNHYDHLDKMSVRALHEKNPSLIWLVPLGVKSWFEKQKIERVIERKWWEEIELSSFFPKESRITATAVPSQHFSGRKATNVNDTLWAGWVVEFEKKRLYFVGDTGYNPYDFKNIGARWKGFDLSLIPIGCYVPRKFMAPVHLEPKDSVRIHQDVGSRLSVGMHWKTFRLSDEPAKQPPYDLFLSLKKAGIDPLTFLALEPGHAINW